MTRRSVSRLALAAVLAAALLCTTSFARAQGAGAATQGEILPGELRAPSGQPAGSEPGSCVSLRQIDSNDGRCRGFIENGCSRVVNLAVTHDVAFRKFVTTPIASAGVAADHHGEPAAGHYEDAGTYQGTMKTTLSPGKGRWFERFHKGEGFIVSECRVTFLATWTQ